MGAGQREQMRDFRNHVAGILEARPFLLVPACAQIGGIRAVEAVAIGGIQAQHGAGGEAPGMAKLVNPAGDRQIGAGDFVGCCHRLLQRALLGGAMQMPNARHLDKRLILGSLTFGAGWGIAGICPGPALVLLPLGHWQISLFVVAMLAGMGAFALLQRPRG